MLQSKDILSCFLFRKKKKSVKNSVNIQVKIQYYSLWLGCYINRYIQNEYIQITWFFFSQPNSGLGEVLCTFATGRT